MCSYRSKEDDLNRISTSIFVTNFPDSFKAKDLFHVCKQYRHVVDSFIPLKRTKEGKRFGFVRFNNVFNVGRLVINLCTIWVDRLKLHANRARFDRAPLNRANAHVKNIAMPVKVTNHTACMGDGAMGGGKSYVNVMASNARSGYSKDAGQNSYVGTVKKKIEFRQIMKEQHIPSLVLDDTCVLDYDYSLALVGKVSDFGLLNNIKTILIKEGFDNFVLKYLGGFWVIIEFLTKERSLSLMLVLVRGLYHLSMHIIPLVLMRAWGMGKLWMIFKRYGTVCDMFMAQKRLRNSKRVYVACDKRSKVNGEIDKGGTVKDYAINTRNKVNATYNDGWYRSVWNGGRNGDRSFVDVVNGGNYNAATTNIGTNIDRRRTIEITQSDTNREILVRSVIGEVKARCFLLKLLVLCIEQGLEKAEVKLLGGLEFMVVFDSERTASNVLEDNEHGFRRWVHKLRKGIEYDGTTCRVTWINIFGVPISSWDENTFKEIAAVHGKILGLHNCRLEGNQNTLYEREQIHTSSKGLIREELYVKVKEKYHKVSIVEEIRDITVEILQLVNH
nr:transposon TX1 [Tanacetum cinerariifolium]